MDVGTELTVRVIGESTTVIVIGELARVCISALSYFVFCTMSVCRDV